MAKLNAKMARKARIACEKWRENFKQNTDQYHNMHSFVLGQQWNQNEEDEMIKTFRKVPLVSNKLGTMSNVLLGEQQQNTPQLQVVPMSDCDEDVALIRELIIKDIMFSTDANTVYQVAAGQAAIGGYSGFGIRTEYAHSKSFDLDIEYFYFKDATRVFWDVGAESVNKTDGLYCGYITLVTREKFRDIYGRDIEEKIDGGNEITQSEEEIALAVQPDEDNDPFSWSDGKGITIIDYFLRKYEKDTLYKMSNGNIYNQEEMDALIEKSKEINAKNQIQNLEQLLQSPSEMPMPNQMQNGESIETEIKGMPNTNTDFGMTETDEILPNPYGLKIEKKVEDIYTPNAEEEIVTLWDEGDVVRIEEKRASKRHKIMHYKFAGDYELDKSEFPSEQLPIVFVDNNSYYDKTGKQKCRSFFGDAKDTQRYINYLRTQSAYILKISRYDQWVGSKKNVTSIDTANNWRTPTDTKGLLTYDESPSGAKPEQIRPPEISQSLFTQYQLAIEDLYTSTGLYPARMGNNGDEASGKAINARTRQGSYSTFVFFNSINRAIAAGGKIVNEMIPRVYDTERVMSLMMPNEGMKNITVNKEIDKYGEKIENDIRKGTFEVRLKPGPSYEGQKEEALQSLRDILQADPSSFSILADLYAENLPLPNTIEIKNRLKTLVPPQIIEAGKTGKMPQQQQGQANPQEAAQLQAQQMDMQFKQAQVQLKQKELEIKEKEMQAEIEIERMKLEIAQFELMGGIEKERMHYLAETDRTESDNAIAHADNMVKILTHKIS